MERRPDRTIPDCAKDAQVGVSTIWRWVAEGKLKTVRYSRRCTRITDEEWERFRSAAQGRAA